MRRVDDEDFVSSPCWDAERIKFLGKASDGTCTASQLTVLSDDMAARLRLGVFLSPHPCHPTSARLSADKIASGRGALEAFHNRPAVPSSTTVDLQNNAMRP